jgi:hypothetical protein
MDCLSSVCGEVGRLRRAGLLPAGILFVVIVFDDFFTLYVFNLKNKFLLLITANCIISTEKLNISSSPDGSKYPFMPGFGIKDIADSGSDADEMTTASAPK